MAMLVLLSIHKEGVGNNEHPTERTRFVSITYSSSTGQSRSAGPRQSTLQTPWTLGRQEQHEQKLLVDCRLGTHLKVTKRRTIMPPGHRRKLPRKKPRRPEARDHLRVKKKEKESDIEKHIN
jgi:hypothetical protein